MPKNLKNLLSDISCGIGLSKKKKNTIMILKTQIWIESFLKDFGVEVSELIKLFSAGGEPKTIRAWINKKRYAQLCSVNRIADKFPGSDYIYKLPVFTLLEGSATEKMMTKVMSPYINLNLNYWHFPSTQNNLGKTPTIPSFIVDSKGLFERGDIYGFMGILYLVRMAEIEGNSFWHVEFLKDAYRALPGFCRYHYFTPYWEEFYDALYGLQCKLPTSAVALLPKKKVIEKQIMANEHRTLRYSRTRDMNYRFTELELPYLVADYEGLDFTDTEFG